MHSATRDEIQRARQLRNRMTDAEGQLWFYLRSQPFRDFRFRRQAPIGPYIVDFVSHRARLIIEVDGGQHATASGADDQRTAWLRSHGFRVMRFWNNEALAETDAVLDRIREALTATPLGGAKKAESAAC